MGNNNLVWKRAALTEPCGSDSAVLSFSAPAWETQTLPLACACLAPSFPSNLQPFTQRGLGAPFRDCYLGDAGCLGRTVTELVSKHKGLLFQKVNAAVLLNYSKKEKKRDVRLGRELQRDQYFYRIFWLVNFLNRNTSEWRIGISPHESFFLIFGSSYSFSSEFRFRAESFLLLFFPRWLFHAVSFFPDRRYWSETMLTAPQAVKTVCDFLGKRRTCSLWSYRHHTNGLYFREAAQDEVWERQRPSASLDLPLALAKEEITSKCGVIFAPVLSSATQKVEQGLNEAVSGAVLAGFIFSPCLVLTQHRIAWEKEKNAFQKRKGAPI